MFPLGVPGEVIAGSIEGRRNIFFLVVIQKKMTPS